MKLYMLMMAALLVGCTVPGCTTYVTSGMTVSLHGTTIDAATRKPVSDVTVELGVVDNGYTARETTAVTKSGEDGAIAHEESVGWCRRMGYLGPLQERDARKLITVALLHPRYAPETFRYTFEETWQKEHYGPVIDLGAVALDPRSESTEPE